LRGKTRHPEAAAISAFARVFDALWRPTKGDGLDVEAVILRGSLRSYLRMTIGAEPHALFSR
jgi:hypothetical protein